jgi:hypothetical protein
MYQITSPQWANIVAMPDGPTKKFYLIKLLPARLKETAKEMSCAEILVLMTSGRSSNQ